MSYVHTQQTLEHANPSRAHHKQCMMPYKTSRLRMTLSDYISGSEPGRRLGKFLQRDTVRREVSSLRSRLYKKEASNAVSTSVRAGSTWKGWKSHSAVSTRHGWGTHELTEAVIIDMPKTREALWDPITYWEDIGNG